MPAPVERFYVVVPLAEGAPTSAPVEVLYAGEFHLGDRRRTVTFTEAHLDQMVENFGRLEESGRIPFNVNHHGTAGTLEEAGAVGWVVDLDKVPTQDGERLSLMATPQWQEDARQAIADGRFKFLSGEIVFEDTDYRTGTPIGCHLRGVALTNTPAIPDLTPITLTRAGSAEERAVRLAATLDRLHLNDSLLGRVRAIIQAFYAAFWDTESVMRAVEDVREDDLIVCEMALDNGACTLWSVAYVAEDDEAVFAPREQWVQMEQVYQPKDGTDEAQAADPLVEPVPQGGPPPAANTAVMGASVVPAQLRAAEGGTPQRRARMNELLTLLGLGADGDALTAVRGLQTQLAALTTERTELQAQLTRIQEQRTHEVDALTAKVTAFETEAQRLAAEVAQLTQAQRARDTQDRIALALRQGRTTKAELDGEDGFLRKLAAEQPTVFDKLMALRPERPDLFTEQGGNGEPAPAAPDSAEEGLEAMLAASYARAEEKGIPVEEARKEILAEHPEWAALTTAKEEE